MNIIRPNVLDMAPYSPGKPIAEVQRELGLEKVIKLASNENPLGPSPKAVQAVNEATANLHLYPDGAAYDLKLAIARRFGAQPSQVIVGNGSDELLQLLGLIFLGSATDEVIVGDPSFVRYDAMAHLAPCRLIKVPLDADLRHDLPAMAAAVTDKTKVVLIANPNNPTGTMVTRQELADFLDSVPPHVAVVLDEAYFEFAAEDGTYPDSLELIQQGQNVIGLRTFSKAYGLAGIRVGYGFAPLEVVDALNRVRPPFNVNSLAQVAAIAALEDHEHVRRTLLNNHEGMAWVKAALVQSGFRVYESLANFLFADLGRPTMPVFQELLRRGVIIRPGETFERPNAIRVSIGTPEEVDEFVKALAAATETVVA